MLSRFDQLRQLKRQNRERVGPASNRRYQRSSKSAPTSRVGGLGCHSSSWWHWSTARGLQWPVAWIRRVLAKDMMVVTIRRLGVSRQISLTWSLIRPEKQTHSTHGPNEPPTKAQTKNHISLTVRLPSNPHKQQDRHGNWKSFQKGRKNMERHL